MIDGAWQTEAVVSIFAPMISASRTAARCPRARRKSPDQRSTAIRENLNGSRDRRFHGGRTTLDERRRSRLVLRRAQRGEPRLCEFARVLNVCHPVVLDRDAKIVADTAADGAGYVGENLERCGFALGCHVLSSS
jgi:hypothetical protein